MKKLICILFLCNFNLLAQDTIKVGDVEVNINDLKTTKDIVEKFCAGCHGASGYGDRAYGPDVHFATPSIAGLDKRYFARQLHNFKSQVRKTEHSHEMNELMSSEFFTKKIIEDLAKYYEDMPALNLQKDAVDKISAKLKPSFQKGKKLFEEKSCAACHGQNGVGLKTGEGPYLLGQNALYVEQRLNYYHDLIDLEGERPIDYHINIMRNIADITKLTSQDMKDLAVYLENAGGVR